MSPTLEVAKRQLTCEPERHDDKCRPIQDEAKGLVLDESEIGCDDSDLGRSYGACIQHLADVQILLRSAAAEQVCSAKRLT
jgi:hypothetical protein